MNEQGDTPSVHQIPNPNPMPALGTEFRAGSDVAGTRFSRDEPSGFNDADTTSDTMADSLASWGSSFAPLVGGVRKLSFVVLDGFSSTVILSPCPTVIGLAIIVLAVVPPRLGGGTTSLSKRFSPPAAGVEHDRILLGISSPTRGYASSSVDGREGRRSILISPSQIGRKADTTTGIAFNLPLGDHS